MTASPKLRFLADTVIAKAEHLQTTDGRLFAVAMTPERAASLRTDIDLAGRTDAFVARRAAHATGHQSAPSPSTRSATRSSLSI